MSAPPTDFPAPFTEGDRVPLFVAFGYVFFLVVFAFSLSYFGVIVSEHQLMQALGVMSLVILMNLASVYIYAYRFYEERFFLFLSFGWFANALYLVFEFFRPESPGTPLAYIERVFLFSMLTNIPFYCGLFIRRGEPFNYKRLIRYTLGWAVPLAASPLLAGPLGDRYELSDAHRFMIFAAGGIALSAWLLFRVGRKLSKRLTPDVYGHGAAILPWTFYLYASLQFIYFWSLVPAWGNVVVGAFFAAFMLKMVHMICVISILTVTRREFIRTKGQLEQRSVFEEIGRIASSIEHDIKTPLGIMSLEIGRMRMKFPANADILDFLQRLEDERRRVHAIAQVVPYLRGDKEFFERYMEKTSALEVVHKAVKNMKRDWKLDPAKFFFKVEGRDQFIRCHRSMLEQALVNVLKNSVEGVRQAQRKTGLIEIKIGLTKTLRRMVVIAVKDNGCGIAEDDIPQLTTLYTTKSHLKPNSGIGLFIANRIVRMHDGRIDIESNLGTCTSVSFNLPEWAETPEAAAPPPQSVAEVSLNPAQV
ncbi:MAG: hypothetical protein QOJ70_3481 [Acidobacteriota bacterium]|jgi:signal transduction histidine kinase|nr:hypothetical protein [Acidobacteriota bacterium]